MNVKLTSISKPVFNLKNGVSFEAEDLIIYCARVSNPENQGNRETYPKLMDYLIKSHHWSPFEMVSMCVEIETSRAIAQQILRHRSFSFQEFSQRYSVASEIEPVELRYQAETNRQSSTDVSEDPWLIQKVNEHMVRAQELYNELLAYDVAKETARMILPLATQTTMYMHGTVRSWIHYLQQRCDEHAQKEHRLIAMEIGMIFIEQFPNVAKALDWQR